MDIAGSSLLLLCLSPLLLLVTLLVAIESPGPIFFRQPRLGKDSKPFNVVKFRTMIIGAEDKLAEMLESDPVMQAEYLEYHKLEKDPRVTKLGYFLRKYSLDELPQFWNVLKGEMSLSGPRAYMLSELENMGSYAAMIFRVRPGITGWWQVLGRHQTSFQKRLQMDEYYISNWSLWMDAYITIRTILVILTGNGA
jgi:lipopolysaccharide/colanic/teichoic acid biosynthesis glycosyltransferase